jgi:hypothetical protein
MDLIERLKLPKETYDILKNAPSVVWPNTIEEMIDAACGGKNENQYTVSYTLPNGNNVTEANVARVRNGLSANYTEPYMRRRDPDCMVIGDEYPTDKPRFSEQFGYEFNSVRKETFDWLQNQDLAAFCFYAGDKVMGLHTVAITPLNASFFAMGLALLQGFIPPNEIPDDFCTDAVIYVAPPFRHTHFEGKQVVVHNRQPECYELFSYNLYPGPSAKKGVYGMLLDLGERQGWTTTHCSAVKVITPYDNEITIMHEGASGGGKSEMLEQPHRSEDGRWVLGENIVTNEIRHLQIPRSCDLRPVTDDMALCHPTLQHNNGKLRLTDAENSWFIRVNHINGYGVDPNLEKLTAQPSKPLLFLNIDAEPGSRALIWEHIQDAPGKSCPNPRVTVPRDIVPNIVNEPITIDVRSFGVRTPPCTKEKPTYGILGMFHILPPALAWLWRLVSPRGYDNPSILDDDGMSSEGVGSYWPFATGRKVTQANILLNQFIDYRRTRHLLIPNQYIGAWHVGFIPEWVTREYMARRGASRFRPEQIRPARCSLLGHAMHQLHVEGQQVARWFLQVNTQPEVGEEAYDIGAGMLYDFFHSCLQEFNTGELDPVGQKIIQCCLDRGTVEDYESIIPVD